MRSPQLRLLCFYPAIFFPQQSSERDCTSHCLGDVFAEGPCQGKYMSKHHATLVCGQFPVCVFYNPSIRVCLCIHVFSNFLNLLLQTSCGPGFRRRDRCTWSCPLGNNHEKSILDTLRFFRKKQRCAVQVHRSLCSDVAFHRPHKRGASRRGHMYDKICRLRGSLRDALFFACLACVAL